MRFLFALGKMLLLASLPAAVLPGADLSRYRAFRVGMGVREVARLAGVDPSQVKLIHSRPVLIQDLEWRPQPLGPAVQHEAAREIRFSFYDGALFRIVVSYDRYSTEGLTTEDLVEVISRTYGAPAPEPTPQPQAAESSYSDETVLARWRDSEHSLELIRSGYGPAFSLVVIGLKADALAQSSVAEAIRLDELEAPQRAAERTRRDEDAERSRQSKARLANKPGFRP